MDSVRDPHPAVEALRRRFRAQRPLRGGSLLMTIFGDAIAPRGGRVTLGSLIGLSGPFGLAERLVRTAVARLAAEGWLIASRQGRRSEYRLSESGRERFSEATQRIYGVNPTDWGGRWTLLILPPGHPTRGRLREELRWLGFGPLAPRVFAHPTCTLEDARGWLTTRGFAREGWLLKSATEGLTADRRLAATGWDLAEIARRYRKFRDTFAPLDAASDLAALPPQSAFVVRTLLIHEYRKTHLRDPLLPPALLPQQWIGAEAYALCKRLYAAVFPASERHLTQCAATLHGGLPQPGPEIYARFGGVTSP